MAMNNKSSLACLMSDVFNIIESIVPQSDALDLKPETTKLSMLGFDSMAIISLFAALEDKLGFSVDALTYCLDRACTLGSLLEICQIAQTVM
jgi:acyl carrier protein